MPALLLNSNCSREDDHGLGTLGTKPGLASFYQSYHFMLKLILSLYRSLRSILRIAWRSSWRTHESGVLGLEGMVGGKQCITLILYVSHNGVHVY